MTNRVAEIGISQSGFFIDEGAVIIRKGEYNLKHDLLIAIVLSLVVVSAAHAEPEVSSKKLLEKDKTGMMHIGNGISPSVSPATGIATTPGFSSINALAPTLAVNSVLQATSVLASFEANIAPITAGQIFAQPAINTISAATYSPTLQPPSAAYAATAAEPVTNAKLRQTSGSNETRKNLSCDTALKTTLFTNPGEAISDNKKLLSSPQNASQHTFSSMVNLYKGTSEPNYAPKDMNAAPVPASFVSTAKRVSISAALMVKRGNASIINGFSGVKHAIDVSKPLTTQYVKILAKAGEKINAAIKNCIKSIIPMLKMSIAAVGDQESMVLSIKEQFTLPAPPMNNDQDPGMLPIHKTTAGNGNDTVQPFSDTVSRHVSDQLKPLNHFYSLIISVSSVNYAKTGLSPPETASNLLTSFLFSQDCVCIEHSGISTSCFHTYIDFTIFSSIPLPLNHIVGFNRKGFSIFTDVFNQGGAS